MRNPELRSKLGDRFLSVPRRMARWTCDVSPAAKDLSLQTALH
jgi:hypothetical protein